MLNIHQQFLQTLHPNLITGDESIDGQSAVAAKEFEKEIAETAKINPDLKPEIQDAKRTEILSTAFDKYEAKTQEIAKPVLSATHMVHAELAEEARPKLGNNDIEMSIQNSRMMDDRAALRGMSVEDRKTLLLETVSKCDGRVLHAIEGSLDLSRGIALDTYREIYLKAAKPDLVRQVAEAEAKADRMRLSLQAVSYAAKNIAKKAGLDLEQALSIRQEARRAKARTMFDAEKVQYINEHGSEGFRRLLAGE